MSGIPGYMTSALDRSDKRRINEYRIITFTYLVVDLAVTEVHRCVLLVRGVDIHYGII